MEKTIVVTLADFAGYYLRDPRLLEDLVRALRGDYDGRPFQLSTAGILFEGKGGHMEILFKHRELFLRFNQTHRDAQKGFVASVYNFIDREHVRTLYIKIEYGPEKGRTMTATFSEEENRRYLHFDLA